VGERVLLVSIEAMELSLLRQGAREGWLPTLGTLLESGACTRIAGVPGGLPGSDWPSLTSGRTTADHLVTFFRQLKPGTYRVEPIDPSYMRTPPFWRFVSDAGKRTTVVSVHGAPRLRDFLGTQVTWGTPEPFVATSRPSSDPPEVVAWLTEAFPHRRWGFLPKVPQSEREFREYVESVRRGVREQGEALAMLMERTEWDLFFGNFAELHEAGHLLWHLERPGGPADLRHALRRLYEDVDRALGRALARKPADTKVFVVTPNGMRDAYPTFHATEAFLAAGGWLRQRPAGTASADPAAWWARQARAAARRLTPLSLRQLASRRMSALREKLAASTTLAHIDWGTTSAFPLPQDSVSSIRFNVAGREPAGIVERGPNYDRLWEEIADAANSLVDRESGARAAAGIFRTERVFGIPVRDILPDLVIEWSPQPIRVLKGPEIGEIEVRSLDPRTGYHTNHGFLLGSGPGIPKGAGDFDGEPASILDVAPTILNALGLDPPPELPGRPLAVFGGIRPEGR
jgi:predicted AlkP superfamily phosphohydrolase/phosphomutase